MRRSSKRWASAPALLGLVLIASSCVELIAVTPGDGQLTVAFTVGDTLCPEDCTVVAEASVDASFSVIAGSATGTASPLTITGLTNGTPYHVRAYVPAFSGGERSEYEEDGTRYVVHTFSTVGTHDIVLQRGNINAAVLIVGGGGAGGASAGGGGGAGGVVEAVFSVADPISLEPGPYRVTVGAGGAPSFTNGPETDGDPSSLVRDDGSPHDTAHVALGGGGGMSMENTFPGPGGRDGASGGGGTRATNVGTASSAGTPGGATLQPASASGGFGDAGGAGLGSSGSDTQGGGGGGAAGAGVTPTVGTPGGDGGAGRTSTITGVSIDYAGGGGGGAGSSYERAGAGGSGGGGAGGVTTAGTVAAGSDGGDGRGGGGGGGSARDGAGALGGAGGSGVVIIRYAFDGEVWDEPVAPVAPVDVGAAPAASGPVLSCDAAGPQAGASFSCVVTSADPGIDFLWRAAASDAFAEGAVTVDGAGEGTFTFEVPRSVVGRMVTVELVAWLAPLEVGVAGGAVPTRVPAGVPDSDPSGSWAGAPVGVTLVLPLALLLALARAPRPDRRRYGSRPTGAG